MNFFSFAYEPLGSSLQWSVCSNLFPIFLLTHNKTYISSWSQMFFIRHEYLLPFCWMPFHSLADVFWWTEFFYFKYSPNSFIFTTRAFCVLFKNSLTILRSWYKAVLHLFLKIIIILPFIFSVQRTCNGSMYMWGRD